jgi:hypothetical protein
MCARLAMNLGGDCMNTILFAPSEKMPFHTCLGPIFEAFEGQQKEFNWLIMEFECNHLPTAADWHNEQKIWITGEELTKIIDDDDIQFIWGEIFGFGKEIDFDTAMKNFRPRSKRRDPINSKNPQIQNSLATFQIICFDGGFTVLLSKDDNLSKLFRSYFKESMDLKESRRKRQKTR